MTKLRRGFRDLPTEHHADTATDLSAGARAQRPLPIGDLPSQSPIAPAGNTVKAPGPLARWTSTAHVPGISQEISNEKVPLSSLEAASPVVTGLRLLAAPFLPRWEKVRPVCKGTQSQEVWGHWAPGSSRTWNETLPVIPAQDQEIPSVT